MRVQVLANRHGKTLFLPDAVGNAKEDSLAASFDKGLAWLVRLHSRHRISRTRSCLASSRLDLFAGTLTASAKILLVELEKNAIQFAEGIDVERLVAHVSLERVCDSFADHAASL